jgi:dihydrofolate reductase
MRKIIVSEMMTVDGFFAGSNGEIDWHRVDAEFNESAVEMLSAIDALIFGRVTYDLMASYWPGEEGLKDDPVIAAFMNSLPKIVFSKTRDKLEWNNSRLLGDIVPEEIKKMKQETGKDIAIFGSGTIVQQFIKFGLIDDYRLIVNPVVLGQGKPLFGDKMNLKLLRSKEFKNGNVMLYYVPLV